MSFVLKFTKKDFYFSMAAGLASGLIFWRVAVFLGLTPVHGLSWAYLVIVLPLLWVSGVNLGYFLGKWVDFFNQFGKFAVAGFTSFAVDLGVLNLLIARFGFASGLIFSLFKTTSFLVAMIHGYFLDKYWAFGAAKSKGGGLEFFKFFGVSVLSLLINVGVASLLVSKVTPWFGLEIKTWASLSAVAGSAAALIFNFLGFRVVVFNKQKGGEADALSKISSTKFFRSGGTGTRGANLAGALQTGHLAHAYLFTGPRGTGKTTLARILAKAANCPILIVAMLVKTCEICREVEHGQALDLIEIDAASNRGIDEIRALREGTRFSSMRGQYKTYIIDECHMLTKEASNALLKTIEEPPAKTLFVLATTEPHKVLPTIISRVQRFDFKKLSVAEIVSKLAYISQAEKLKISSDLLRLIALRAEGSLRDAESNLSKLVAFRGDHLDEEALKEVLGFVPFSLFHQFLDLVYNKNSAEAVVLINRLYDSGLDLDQFLKGLLDYARKVLVLKTNATLAANWSDDLGLETVQHMTQLAQKADLRSWLGLLKVLLRAQEETKISPIPQLPLELAIAELTSL